MHLLPFSADELTHTGSEGCEEYLALADREGLGSREIDDDFIAAHRRERLNIDWS